MVSEGARGEPATTTRRIEEGGRASNNTGWLQSLLSLDAITSTTICQTIEIGRILKDLKGFERILLDFSGIVRRVDRFFGT